jgi:hypothetical protein
MIFFLIIFQIRILKRSKITKKKISNKKKHFPHQASINHRNNKDIQFKHQ